MSDESILYIALSLDGFIARRTGAVDWLAPFEKNPDGSPQDHGYNDFIKSIRTVVMGSKTYEQIGQMNVPYPYADKDSVVFSRRDLRPPENGRITAENPAAVVSRLKREKRGPIWVVGGGQIVSQLLDAGMIDEMRLFFVPVMLGEGIALNPNASADSLWRTTMAKKYETGVVEGRYRRAGR